MSEYARNPSHKCKPVVVEWLARCDTVKLKWHNLELDILEMHLVVPLSRTEIP